MKLPILYSRTAKGAVNTWECWTEGADVCCRWGQMGGTMQTSRFTCEPKNVGKKNATTAEEQAVKEAQALHVKQQKKKYNTSIESAGETVRVKPMLAKAYEDRKGKIKFPVTVQPKLDGVRCLAYRVDGKVVLQSRGGDFYDVEHIRSELENILGPDDMLDGELYIHHRSLQNINSLVKRPQSESRLLQYWVYDAPVEDKPWNERNSLLNKILSRTQSFDIVDVDSCQFSKLVESEADVSKFHKDSIQDGFEGAIVRTMDGLYKFGARSSDLLKVKSWKDAEFTICGWERGKGKFEDVPTFKCLVNPDLPATEDNTFDVTPKGSREERLELLNQAPDLIGQLMKVKFFDYSPDGIPLYPVGLSIRDKSDLS